ncbi:MAG: hypothetical protein PF961_03080 [Planctomycetota bacterium]|jgi:hypothetical protein|nr:hypothetical protein [Planctomycetota bacterium]
MRRLCLLICVAVIALGPSRVTQLVAWGGMLAERAPAQGLAEAVATTFSGEAPCPLCHAAEAMEKLEQRGDRGGLEGQRKAPVLLALVPPEPAASAIPGASFALLLHEPTGPPQAWTRSPPGPVPR